MKYKEEQLKAITNRLSSCKIEDSLLEETVHVVFDCLSEKKFKNKVAKIIKSVIAIESSHGHDLLEESVALLCKGSLTPLSARKVSSMFEIPSLRNFIRANGIYLLKSVSNYFSQSMKDINFIKPEELNLAVKVCLQIFQYLPDIVSSELLKKIPSIEGHTHAHSMKILANLFKLLSSKNVDKDCLLLAGTAVAMLFNCCPIREDIITSVSETVDWLTLEHNHDYNLVLEIGSHHVALPSFFEQSLSGLSLIIGLLNSCDDVILFRPKENNRSIFMQCFDVLRNSCKAKTACEKYVAFQGILAWLTCLKRLNVKTFLSHNNQIDLFTKDSNCLKILLEIVFTYCEDMIDGVSETVQEIFRVLIGVHIEEELVRNNSYEFKSSNLSSKLLNDIMVLSWYEKSKYRLLLEMIPYIGQKKILDAYPNLPSQLLICLTTCNLPSISNEVYKSLLRSLRKESKESFLLDWQQHWKTWLMESLTSNNRSVRLRSSEYWAPTTLSIIPEAHSLLVTEVEEQLKNSANDNESSIKCEERDGLLYAYFVIITFARKLGLTHFEKIDVVLLQEGLESWQEDIRMEAFSVICANLKKLEKVSSIEMKLILKFLQSNMNSAPSPLRQSIFSSLKTLLARLANNCLMLFKDCNSKKSKFEKKDIHLEKELIVNLDFVSSLFELFRNGLLPGSSFKHKKSALLLYAAILNGFDTKHKLTDQGHAANPLAFLTWSEQKHYLQFAEKSNVEMLIYTLEDQHDEVRNLAYELLMKIDVKQNQETVNYLSQHSSKFAKAAFALVHSARMQEVESGTLLVKFILQFFVDKLSYEIYFDNNVWHMSHENNTGRVMLNTTLAFLRDLIKSCENQLRFATEDCLFAAKKFPIFGLVFCFHQCLSILRPQISSLNHHEWMLLKTVLGDFISFGRKAVDFTLSVLSGEAKPTTGVSPSFADTGEALKSSLKSSKLFMSKKNSDADIQYFLDILLSFSWQTIKTIGVVFSDFGWLLSSGFIGNQANNTHFTLKLVDEGDVRSVWLIYLDCLTKCRHKGVIECCAASFGSFCLEVSRSPWLRGNCKQWLDGLIEGITSDKITTSVTKRSAGIPMIIQAIVAAEVKAGRPDILNSTIETLLSIAQEKVDGPVNINVDLKQFHAINVLKALYRDAALGNSVLQFAEKGVQLTVDGFASPSWSIRSASALLLGTLVTRMLGHQTSKEGAGTPQELFTKYTELESYFSKVLQEQVLFSMKGKHHVSPRVVPVLTFLSKLTPALSNANFTSRKDFTEILAVFSTSPVHALRVLSASASIGFTNQSEHAIIVQNLMTSFHRIMEHPRNNLHGRLIHILKILEFHAGTPNEISFDVAMGVINNLEQAAVVLFENVKEYFTLSTFLDIIQCSLSVLHSINSATDKIWVCVENAVNHCLHSLPQNKDVSFQVGVSLFGERLAELVALVAIGNTAKGNDLKLLRDALAITNFSFTDKVITNSATHLHEQTQHQSKFNQELLKTLSEYCCNNIITQPQNLAILGLFIQLARLNVPLDITLTNSVAIYESINRNILDCPAKAAIILPLLSTLLAIIIKSRTDTSFDDQLQNIVDVYSTYSMKWCSPNMVETARLGVALSLHFFDLTDWINLKLPFVDAFVPILINISLQLLEDQDEDVRQETAKAVISMLQTDSKCQSNSYCHANIALDTLLQFISSDCFHNSNLIDVLLSYFYAAGTDDLVSESHCLFEQEDSNIYIEPHNTLGKLAKCLKNSIERRQGDVDSANIDNYLDHLEEKSALITEMLTNSIIYYEKNVWGITSSKKFHLQITQLTGLAQILYVCKMKEDQSRRLTYVTKKLSAIEENNDSTFQYSRIKLQAEIL